MPGRNPLPPFVPIRLTLPLAALLCSALLSQAIAADKTTLTVAGFAGAYSHAQTKSIFNMYTEETGIDVELVQHHGGMSALPSDTDTGPRAHVVNIDLKTAQKACEEGALMPLQAAELVEPEKEVPLTEDFVPNGISRCALANSVNSLVIVFEPKTYEAKAPKSVEDFFDLAAFPGKRGLRPDPHSAIVLATIAAGTPPQNVYETLESAQGVESAFRMLAQIENDIIWWRNGQEATDFLVTNTVAMTTAFHSWAYRARVSDNRQITLIWKGQQADLDVWAIPKGAAKQSLAANFIRFVTGKEQMAAQSNLMPYGPGRRSAFPLINAEMREHLPNTPEHGQDTVWLDHSWWSEHGEPLSKRFAVWLAKTDQI